MSSAPVASPSKERVGVLLPLAVAAAGALCLWKVIQTCSVPVHPRCVSVVYDTRRKTVLCTSADREMRADALPRVVHFSPALYLSSALMYCSRTRLFVPPSSFFGVFTLPRGVFEEPGEAVNCAVEGIAVSDGSVNMMVTVFYTIPFEQMERYLAAVGPVPPNEVIAKTVAHVARLRCAELSAGILLSKNRRDGVFMGPFKEHLTWKLMSEAAVAVSDVVVEQAILLEGS
ncbi:hypothetical protein ABB37_10094 [Leptomonas pyrrhocoris]|uniref:Uncharacterized protein n=1 Tax=Leptomonas pyrrhocoris TaxID=157538 RepID=A0A0M9FPC6_LEPPY|nr:hypothetical protein ABB37_10094 [Leptomonas pyrrhocoris]XP_015651586.1 hypothetical protein ABB37_10094 [Leptomonas pyrrhocoris]XP_015651587.1 hypothetical protein ABB37_10094 [Leptomonas pyrrhocoris]KPA73146.1 hypothetical protein ABB37_10094 [Leptomonas pyrrhocoris]KPA73147.1 hypothetical protein ABB37_10094 [Leptomonas pyrrhocoris]KPA73148.1 hypothetical protein ABB37_10094 [Leptomonas pyrrhocoris]|eukprot:XP_015651585.1 hypothetical protein ABB37_10094 [Leptomonas pyrrhocoris]